MMHKNWYVILLCTANHFIRSALFILASVSP